MKLGLIVMAAALAVTNTASAQDLGGTLQKIKDKGAIVIGHRETSIPFSYYDNKQVVVGYSQDIAIAIVDAIKAELKSPNLQVKLNPVTSQTRIPLMLNGTIDLECGTTTNNLDRQKQVAFSTNFFTVGTRLLTRKTSGITDFPDLRGKNVIVSAGTTSERILRKMNEDKQMGMNIISAKDHGEAFVALEFNKGVALMSDDAILVGEKTKSKRPEDFHIVGASQSNEVYACMIRKDDPAFKTVVDRAVTGLMTTGKAMAIYDKWFRSPIPPRDVNLDTPPSDDVKALFSNPNDKPLQ